MKAPELDNSESDADSDLEDDAPPLDFNNDDDKCCICISHFKKPKLLPCCHTFCLDCLNNLSMASTKRDMVVCPMCRKKSNIPSAGMHAFMTNYFIKSLPDMLTCHVCDSAVSKLITCSECEVELCDSCSSGHGKETTKGRNRCVHSKFEDKELFDYRRQLKRLQHIVKTFYCGTIEFAFSCPYERCVSKIIPMPNDESWILTDNSTEIVRYNHKGQRLSQIRMGLPVDDMCQQKNGSLLILCASSKSVFLYNNLEVLKVLELVNYHPSCLLVLENVLAIAVMKEPSTETSECEIMFYNDEFTYIASVGKEELGSLEQVNSMAYKLDTKTVCLADEVNGHVRLLNEGHAPLTYVKYLGFPIRYRGGGFDNERYRGFKPRALCCDRESNLFVYDHASALTLIISSSAKLIGILITNDEELTGDPNCLSFDNDGKLWIGDAFSGRVRAYKVEKTYNNLISSSIPGNSEPNHGFPSVLIGADGNVLSTGQNSEDMLQGIGNPLSMHHGIQTSEGYAGINIPPELNLVESLPDAERRIMELETSLRRKSTNRGGNMLPAEQHLDGLLQIAKTQLSLLKNLTGESSIENTQGNISNNKFSKEGLPAQIPQLQGDLTVLERMLTQSTTGNSSNSVQSVGANFDSNAEVESSIFGSSCSGSRSTEVPYFGGTSNQSNMVSPQGIQVNVRMFGDGTLLPSSQSETISDSSLYGVESCESVGSLIDGPNGIMLNLPRHILNNPELKQIVIRQISLQTGVSEEYLANMAMSSH